MGLLCRVVALLCMGAGWCVVRDNPVARDE